MIHEIPNNQENSFDRFEQHLEKMTQAWEKVGKSKKRLDEFIEKFGLQQAEQMRMIYGLKQSADRIRKKEKEIREIHELNGRLLDKLGDALNNM